MRPRRLRMRLLAALVAACVGPLAVLAGTVDLLLRRSFEEGARLRLQSALTSFRGRLTEMEARAAAQVAAVAERDLALAVTPPEGERALAGVLAPARGLTTLTIATPDGRIVSSHHWPAGFGLPDPGRDLTGASLPLRLETVAEGFGGATRIALMPSRPGVWRGQPVVVRGGVLLDEAFLADLTSLSGALVALRDAEGHAWIAPSGSPLGTWAAGEVDRGQASGEALLADTPHAWAAFALAPGLRLVVAVSRSGQLALARSVRGATLGLTAAALLGSLLLALTLSARLARPVDELAAGARRVAAGDLSRPVPVQGGDELAELARAFNAMTDQLRVSREHLLQAERVASWREMARRLAHELKNPLFPIQLSVETLARMDPRPDPEAFARSLQESADTILQELHALRRVIDEFSQFARMPRPDLRAVDLAAVVDRVLGLYQARAGQVELRAQVEEGLPPIQADEDLLARALGNLVANALEAMPAGGTLTVRCRATAAAGVEMEVEDTGPGLSEEQRTRLFTPYYTTKKGGTGLGLAIVQGIVADHGGRVEVRSEPGHGSTFVLQLPARSGAAEPPAARS